VPAGSDLIADKIREDDPAAVVKFYQMKKFDNTRFGSFMPTQVRIYRRDRSDPVKAIYKSDIVIVVETQKDLGFGSVDAQLAALDLNQRRVLAGANWVAGVYNFQPGPQLMDWAILTQNLTCSMCHMKVQNKEMIDNTDPTKYDQFSRVKVGTTDFLGIRPSSANTSIDGSLFHRGRLESELDGVALTPAQFCAATVGSSKFVPGSANLDQNSAGNVTAENFVNALPQPDGVMPPNKNLYLNLPTDKSKLALSGDLPTEFPAPFKDFLRPEDSNRGNNKVDTDEVEFMRENSNGKITGFVETLSPGAKYNKNTLPNSNVGTIDNGHQGTVIITGTKDNPIHLDGRVVIDGDVMISGYVVGTGQLYASGNIYVPGDLQYKNKLDASNKEIFGVGQDGGQDVSNLFAMSSGGNIVIGDYLSTVTHWDSGKDQFYRSGVPEPGKRETFKTNYYTPAADQSPNGTFRNPYEDLNGINKKNSNNQTTEVYNMANFVVEQLAVFNRQELLKTLPKLPNSGAVTSASAYTITNNTSNNTPNSVYDPTYIPKYYSFYEYDNSDPAKNPIPLYLHSGTSWDSSKKRWNGAGDPHGYGWITEMQNIPDSVQNPMVTGPTGKKNVLHIHPTWMDPSMMMQLLSNVEKDRPSEPRHVDGLLYTNNAIFAIERKKAQRYDPATGTYSKVNSKSGGRMIVNGALVAPDLGVLVTQASGGKSFTLNYDARVMDYLPLESPAKQFGVYRRAFTKNFGPLSY
jgi:hypothetical protein